MSQNPNGGDKTAEQPSLDWRFWKYSLFTSLWLAGLFWVADASLEIGSMHLFIWSAFLATPSALLIAQRSHVRRSDFLRHWRQGSRWHKFWSGASMRPALGWLVASFLCFGLLVHVAIDPELRWQIIWVAILLPPSVWCAKKMMRDSLKAPWFSFAPIGLGTILAAGLVFFGHALFGAQVSEVPANLAAARAKFPCYQGDSALLDVIFELTTFTAAFLKYGVALAEAAYPDGRWALRVGALVAETSLLLVVACSLAPFLLPASQMSLGLKPVGEDPSTPKDASRRLIVQQAGFVAVAGFAGKWFIGGAETFAEKEKVSLLLRSGTVTMERIDSGYYPAGTITELELFERRAQVFVNTAVDVADREIVAAFKRARGRVDAYLDWHFSLEAEAFRIIGSYKIAEGLRNKLGLSVLYQSTQVAMARLDGATKGLKMIDDLINDILNNQKIDKDAQRSRHVVTAKRADLVPTSQAFLDQKSFPVRMGAAGTFVAAGGLSGALLGSYVARQATVRGGAVIIGSGLGLALPIVGTAAGLLFGVVIGTLADWAMLKLNERVHRKKMHQELLSKLYREERHLRQALAALRRKPAQPSKPQIEPRCKVPVARAL